MLRDQVLHRRRVGAGELLDLLAVLEEEEGGHSADVQLLGEIGEVVDVKLGEVDLVLEGVGFGPPGVGVLR